MLDTFFIYGDIPPDVEKGIYQLPLVVLSFMVASFASYTALSLAQQLTNVRDIRERTMLHWGGAFAMGAGIWSMHFIGMLSYKMDMAVKYNPLLTFFSMLIAIAFSYGVLAIVARKQLFLWQIITGGILLGIGICSMHYTGMAAMQMDGDLRYTLGLFFLSVAIAIIASAAALWIAFTLARHNSRNNYLFQIGAALLMGAAICGMHYTGMAASVIVPWANCRYDPDQDFNMLAISIAIATSIILGLALAIGSYKKTQTEFQLQNSENKLRSMIDSALDAVIGMDQQGKITEWNRQAEVIFGWLYSEAIGKSLAQMIIPSEHHDSHNRGLQRFLADGTGPILSRRIEVEALNRRGEQFPVELSIAAQKLHDNTYQFTAFLRDITVRKDVEEKLQHYMKELEESNRELDDFSYIASHDLKEPLRGLHNFSRFLLEDYQDKLDDEGKNMLYTIADLTKRMDELLSSLLHYSRLGRTELSVRATSLDEMARNAIVMHAVQIKETNTKVEILQELPTAVCDYVRIAEVFQNLIGNALKYNDKQDRKIEIGYLKNHTRYPGEDVYFVRDNGIGIEPKNLEAIFKIFRRLHAKDAYGGGTGSGLTIARKIITQHGGYIWAESQGKGQGTTFFFTIPADPGKTARSGKNR
jgi:PAS domain S-box-containing protein